MCTDGCSVVCSDAPAWSGATRYPQRPVDTGDRTRRHVPACASISFGQFREKNRTEQRTLNLRVRRGWLPALSAISPRSGLLQPMPRGAAGNADRASATRSQQPGPFPCSARPLRNQACTASTLCRPSGLLAKRKAARRYIEATRSGSPASTRIRQATRTTRGAAPATAGRSARGTATPHAMPPHSRSAAGRAPDASHPGPGPPGRPRPAYFRTSAHPGAVRAAGRNASPAAPRGTPSDRQPPAPASKGERPAQCRMRSRNGYRADPVRGKPTVTPTAQPAWTPSAMRPWTSRHIDPQ